MPADSRLHCIHIISTIATMLSTLTLTSALLGYYYVLMSNKVIFGGTTSKWDEYLLVIQFFTCWTRCFISRDDKSGHNYYNPIQENLTNESLVTQQMNVLYYGATRFLALLLVIISNSRLQLLLPGDAMFLVQLISIQHKSHLKLMYSTTFSQSFKQQFLA